MSSPRSTTTTALAVAGAAVLGGIVAYALYFDYKRRNDIQFRKQLRKEQKRVKRAKTENAAAASSASAIDDDDLKVALERLRKEPIPSSTQDREQYFSKHIADGEMTSMQGPAYYLDAALSFYRGLRVYPAPVELIMIYQKTVPEPIFNILMKLTTLDVKNRGEGYYEHFPPPSMNVAVKQVAVPSEDGKGILKNVLVATRDFSVGEVIYTEFPMAAVLDGDLEGSGMHCSQCLRKISGVTHRPKDDPLNSTYCSTECQELAGRQHHAFLFGLGSLVSVDPTPPPPEPRRAAQTQVAQLLKKTGHNRLLLTIRLFAHQVMSETAKVLPMLKPDEPAPPPSILPEPVGEYASEYGFADHVERLRYLEMHASPEELSAMRKLFSTALNSEETGEFMTDERYETLKGKVAYNAIGVAFGGGRENKKNKPPTDLLNIKEEIEWARTPLGIQRQVGAGLYRVSSYLTHSCTPSARPTFPKGTYELHLVASRSITKGEELTMAYVEVARVPGESAEQCWARRRAQLVDGWRFVCRCARCVEERPKQLKQETIKDEARVEDAVNRFEATVAA